MQEPGADGRVLGFEPYVQIGGHGVGGHAGDADDFKPQLFGMADHPVSHIGGPGFGEHDQKPPAAVAAHGRKGAEGVQAEGVDAEQLEQLVHMVGGGVG